jgi:HrpA-like RNA helicase
MSATLGGGLAEGVASLMQAANEEEKAEGEASREVPCISSEGRSYPVKTTYLGKCAKHYS